MPNFETIAACIGAFLVLVIVALSIWLFVDSNRINSLKVENKQYEEANEELSASIAKQNEAVLNYQKTSIAIATAAAKAIAEAKKNSATMDAAIASLQSAKPSKDVCKSANDLFNLYIARKP